VNKIFQTSVPSDKRAFFESRVWTYVFIIILFSFSIFLSFYNLGKQSLNNWDEGIYAEITAGMEKMPSFSMTYFGADWLQKPFLGFWLHSAGVDLFGLNNFGLRAMSSLFFVGSVLLFYYLLKKFYSKTLSFLISLAFLVCPLFYSVHMIRTADLDVYFLFFTILSFFLYVLSWEKTGLFWLSGLSAGLAFMTRGYSAVLIVLVIGLHYLWLRRSEQGRKLRFLNFFVTFLIIILPWHIYAFIAHHSEFINNYLGYHFWGRITIPLEGHVGDAWFYISYLSNRLFIFIMVFLGAALFVPIKFVRQFKNEDLLWILWFWIFFLSLQVMQTKITWYIAALIPSLFCLLASLSDYLALKAKENVIRFNVVALLLFICYFISFFIYSFDYVWRPIILPVDTFGAYLERRSSEPDAILVLSKLDDLQGPAAKFQWSRIGKYNVIWLKEANEIPTYLKDDTNFVILTDGGSYQELKGILPKNRAYSIKLLDYFEDAWGANGVPVILDSAAR